MSDDGGLFSAEDRDDLEISQNLRRSVVKAIAGKGIPDDPDMIKVALAAAKDMSAQVFTSARIKADRQDAASQRQTTDRIAAILASSAALAGKGDTNPEAQVAGLIQDVATVAGEMSIGDAALSMTDIDPNAEG